MADEYKQLLDDKKDPKTVPLLPRSPSSPPSPPSPQVQLHGQTIITQLPKYGYVDRPRQPPDHVGIAMFSLVCCFWPLGALALIFAFRSRYKYIDGDYAGAVEYSNKARNWAKIAIIVGVTVIVGIVLIEVFAVGVPVGIVIAVAVQNATDQRS